MFDNNKIDIIYRIICLLTYILIILLCNSIITICILGILLFLLTIKKKDFIINILLLITFLLFIISNLINNYIIFRVMISIDYIYYFLYCDKNIYQKNNNKYYDIINKNNEEKLEEGEIDKIKESISNKNTIESKIIKEKDYIRFKNNYTYKYDNTFIMFYMVIHLFLLFISIGLG